MLKVPPPKLFLVFSRNFTFPSKELAGITILLRIQNENININWQYNIGKNFHITPYINYAFDLINYVPLLLSSKTIANSPEYCIYTSVMNTYCVNKRGFYLFFFFTSLSLLFPLSFPGHSLQCSRSFLFPFFLGRQRDLNQRYSLALEFLSVYHTTRPRRFVEIYRIKERYRFACWSSNIHNNTTETSSHVYYSGFCL